MSDKPTFFYVTYIRAPQDSVWRALTDPDFTEKYWYGTRVEGDWRVGGKVSLSAPGRGTTDTGEVLAWDPPRRLAYTWNVTFDPVFAREGASKVSFELEAMPGGEVTKLTVLHDGFKPGSKVLEAVSGGWPMVLGSLKSILETGEPLPVTHVASAAEAREQALARAKGAA